jgi:hypothetical protein
MRRTILLAGVLPFVSAFLGGILAFSLVIPSFVEAQESRIRAESVVVVDDSGTIRANMNSGPGARSNVGVFSQAGIPRISMSTGGSLSAGGTQPDEATLAIFPPEGAPAQGSPGSIAILGTGAEGVGSTMQLLDRQGQTRIWLRVDADGNPSIEMRDASGNVTWWAQ